MKTMIVMLLTVLLAACAIVPLDPYYGDRGHYRGAPGPHRQYAPDHGFHWNGHGAQNRHYRYR